MPGYELTNLTRIPLLMLEYAERCGIDRGELLRLASIAPADLEDPDSRLPVSAVLKLWRVILEREEGTAAGVRIGSTCTTTRLGLVGYVMYYSRNLGEALHRFSRYVHIVSEAVQFELATSGERTSLLFGTHPSLLALRNPVEAQLAAVLTVAREITQSDLVPLAINLPFPSPDDAKEYRQFFRCPVHFRHPNAAIVFATSQMRLPIKASDPTLRGYLEELADTTLKSLGAPNEKFADTVRRTLWSELPGGRPNLQRSASRLGISTRTLQRRLRENGTSYSALLEKLRRELSGDLLADKRLGVSDVAFLLGYSEPSALQRAIRRWRPVPPQQYRSG
jgi:AraC-like DNA-binding protein